MKFHFLVFWFLSLSFISFASPKDSLLNEIAHLSDDSLLCQSYIKLCEAVMYEAIDTGNYFGNLALDLARTNKFEELELESLYMLALTNYETGKFPNAIKYYNELVDQSTVYRDTLSLAKAKNGLGLIQWKLRRNDLAIKYFHEVHKYSKILNSDLLYKKALNNIGLINAIEKRFDQALMYFDKLYKFAEEKDDNNAFFLALINKAHIHLNTEKYELAEKELQRCIKIAIAADIPPEISVTYTHFSYLYHSTKEYSKALKNSELALDYANRFNLEDLQIENINMKSKILLAMNQFEESIFWCKKGIQKAKALQLSNPELYETLAESYKRLNNYEAAYKAKTALHEMKDSMFSLEKDKEFAALEISFNSEQTIAENKFLIEKQQKQAETAVQKSIIIVMISAVMILLLALATQLYFARRRERTAKIDLKKEVKRQTAEINKANQELLRTNQELKRFAFITSHDLKEPIRNIGGFISLIKRGKGKISQETTEEYLSYIEKSNYQLKELIDSIMFYSNIDTARKRDREPTDLKDIIKDVTRLLSNQILKKNYKIEFENLPIINYYPYVLKIVLKNLIENGLKYNKSECPTIKIRAIEEGNIVKLFVKDNGIGIDPRFNEKIFEMFSRLNSRDKYTGSGMGLAFCKKILNKYDGQIAVDFAKDKFNTSGSLFILTLDAEVIHDPIESINLAG